MFTTLADLLEAIAALTEEQLTDENRAQSLADVTAQIDPESIDAIRAEAEARTNEILDAGVSDESLVELEAIGVASTAVDAQLAANEAEAVRIETRAAELAQQIIRSNGDGGEGDDAEGEGDGDEAEEPAEGAPAEGSPVEDEEPAEAEGANTRVPVAASARAPQFRATARRPRSTMPPAPTRTAGELPDNIAEWGLVAGANAPGVTAGAPIRTREQLADVFGDAFQAMRAARGSALGGKVVLASVGRGPESVGYTDDQILDDSLQSNMRKISEATEAQRSIVAAGGPCAPTQVRYDLPIIGSDARPVRDGDMVTRFGAIPGGGVRVIPPPVLEELDGGTGIWTKDTDDDPGSTVKECLPLTCPDDDEEFVDAIYRCLEIGNFRARFFPEQVEAWIRLLAINHARVAEINLLTKIGASSTQVTAGADPLLGTLPDFTATLDKAQAVMRYADRLDTANQPLVLGVPLWLVNMIAADEARRAGGYGTFDEHYALAQARIERIIEARNIRATWLIDGVAGQGFGRQGNGPIQAWPDTAVMYLYPAGTHLFLDGGQLDIGTYRDGALIETNDYRMFSETFEGHIRHGVTSWQYTLDTCPKGSLAAYDDTDAICASGS